MIYRPNLGPFYVGGSPERIVEPLDVPELTSYAACLNCSPKLPPSRRCSSGCPYEILRLRAITREHAEYLERTKDWQEPARGWLRRLLRKVKR